MSGPRIPRLAPSRSKAEFFQRLGLSNDNQEHVEIYKKMKVGAEKKAFVGEMTDLLQDEAAAGRYRTSQNPDNLAEQYRSDPNVKRPYTSVQITETAMHREILTIYETASALTKPYYDLGHYVDGRNEENWIIRWCLWHVFRYRDNRGKAKSERAKNGLDVGSPPDDTSNDDYQSGRYYDPVRDQLS